MSRNDIRIEMKTETRERDRINKIIRFRYEYVRNDLH